MMTAFTQFGADSSSGIGALGIDGKAFLIQLVTFVLAYLLLRKFAFKPILKVLTERRTLIEDGIRLGEQMKQENAKLEHKIADELLKARKTADGIIAEAHETSRQTVREAEEKARTKAAGILEQADDRIKADTQRARKQLEKEIVGLVSDATEAIIGEKVDAAKDAQLVDRALKGQQA